MFRTRPTRVFIWAALVLGILMIPIYDRAGGPFSVRPVVRWEVRAPVAGFLREVLVDEGDPVSAGTVLARIAVPELESQITRKQAEIHECEANLRRLEAGPRPEEVAAQRDRVQRAEAWRDLGRRDLEQTRRGFEEQLTTLSLKIEQARAEVEYRSTVLLQAQQLFEKGGLAGQQLAAEKRRQQLAQSALLQAEAEKRSREAAGVLECEAELAQREKDLADTRATLALLQAGNRPEEIDAERARLQRLREEENHLLAQQEKQAIVAQVAGTITTPRLKEKAGQYLERGAVICLVEDLQNLEAEVAVSEQDAKVLVRGERVTLKPRSLPFSKLTAKVDRIAPFALTDAKAPQSTVTVYCRVENEDGLLRTGMTGFGRIYHRVRPLGWIGLNRALRFLRTEFWW